MTTAEIIKQMEKELYEFIASSPPNYPSVWKSLIRSRLRTLLESFGEEITSVQVKLGDSKKRSPEEAMDLLLFFQRLKLKEILENIK